MGKNFDEFDALMRSDQTAAEISALRDEVERRVDEDCPGIDPAARELRTLFLTERERIMLMLRKYHEWANS